MEIVYIKFVPKYHIWVDVPVTWHYSDAKNGKLCYRVNDFPRLFNM